MTCIAPSWCKVVHLRTGAAMATKVREQLPIKQDPKTTRASITFPHDLYDTLERIAKEKKVSVAWIVRDAAEKYVDQQWPLLGSRG